MKNLILIWSLLLPYLAFGQATNSDTQYRNDGETLINGSFEQGKKGYTFTVGSGSTTWAAQSTTSLNGRAMQLTLSAQTFSFKSATTQGSKLSGQNGYIEVYLSANNSGAEICPLVDGVSAPITTPNECQPIIAGVGFKPYGIQKVFGATSLNYEIRGVSNASYTGVIYADDGSAAKTSKIVGVKLDTEFSAQISSTGTISGESKDFINGNCTNANPTVCTFNSGIFTVAPNCTISPVGSTSNARGTSAYSTSSVSASFWMWATQNGSPILDNPMVISCQKTGVDYLNSTAQVFNTSGGWFIDANIGGGNPSLGTSAVSSYTELTISTLDLVVNASKGSAPAEIACASGTASTGLTCTAVNESVGIAFTPPKTGKYEVCSNFTHSSYQSSGSLTSVFQLIETTNTSSAVVNEGGERVVTLNNSNAINNNGYPIRVCGVFNFLDTSKKTIRLSYEQVVAGAITHSLVIADRDASAGQRDIHFTVKPIVENIQASLQGYNSTNGAVNPEFFTVSYGTTNSTTACTSSPCTYLDQIGNYASSITRQSTGIYFLNTVETYSKLKCTGNTGSGVELQFPLGSCSNCSSLKFQTDNFSVTIDSYGTLMCQGIK